MLLEKEIDLRWNSFVFVSSVEIAYKINLGFAAVRHQGYIGHEIFFYVQVIYDLLQKLFHQIEIVLSNRTGSIQNKSDIGILTASYDMKEIVMEGKIW